MTDSLFLITEVYELKYKIIPLILIVIIFSLFFYNLIQNHSIFEKNVCFLNFVCMEILTIDFFRGVLDYALNIISNNSRQFLNQEFTNVSGGLNENEINKYCFMSKY